MVFAATSGGFPAYLIVLYVLFFGALWYFMIRPQSVQQRKHQNLVSSLKRGDRVITSGGIHGVVVEVKDDTVTVQIAAHTDVTVQRHAVQSVIGKVSRDNLRRPGKGRAANSDVDDLTADDSSTDSDGSSPQS
ncbi:MAG: preprotein translocase subunit YajC [Sulfobacillus sp.]